MVSLRRISLKHDGHTLLALDLNAALGRHVDLVVEPAGEGAKISISPGFDLSLALAFRQVQDQFDNLAEYLLDDTWHIWFAGASPALWAPGRVTADRAGRRRHRSNQGIYDPCLTRSSHAPAPP